MSFVFSAEVRGFPCRIEVPLEEIFRGKVKCVMPHRHHYAEFQYVFSGSQTLLLPEEGRSVHLQGGDFALIPCDLFHGCRTEEENEVERLCIHLIAEEENPSPFTAFLKEKKDILVLHSPAVAAAMERVRALLSEERNSLRDLREGLFLLETVVEFFRHFSSENGGEEKGNQASHGQEWIIRNHIYDDYYKNDGLEGLAEKLGMSCAKTRKLVCELFGQDFRDLIIRQRMEMAELLLKEGRKGLVEISARLGYRSYSGFHLCFTRTHGGMTPRAYREKYKSGTDGDAPQ